MTLLDQLKKHQVKELLESDRYQPKELYHSITTRGL